MVNQLDSSEEAFELPEVEDDEGDSTTSIYSLVEPTSPKLELEKVVLAGLCGASLTGQEQADRWAYSLRILSVENFEGNTGRLWVLCNRYFALVGKSPTTPEMDELLSHSTKIPLPNKIELKQLYDEVTAIEISEARFRFSCQQFIERWKEARLARALAISGQILSGAYSPDDGKVLSGMEDAQEYLAKELSTIDLQRAESYQEGDFLGAGNELTNSYYRAKRGETLGIATGFNVVDDISRGLQPGELWLIAGFTGVGKSKFAYNVAYNAAIEQGKHVVFGTAEVPYAQVVRNLAVRHTHHPKFGLEGGLRYSDVRNGTLTEANEMAYRAVLQDLEDKANGYGHVHVFTVPYRASVSYIKDVLDRQCKLYHVDMVVVDYFGLLGAPTKRVQTREEQNDILIAAKRMATDAHSGQGVALLSPWQISRQSHEAALVKGKYDLSCLADTSQAERSSDMVLSLLQRDSAKPEITGQILKYRDGEGNKEFDLTTEFETSLIKNGGFEANMGAML